MIINHKQRKMIFYSKDDHEVEYLINKVLNDL